MKTVSFVWIYVLGYVIFLTLTVYISLGPQFDKTSNRDY